jgi:peptidoglycan-N-acetylglucosamine deacetylase
LKLIYIPGKTVIKISCVFLIIVLALIYSFGAGFKLLNVFLSTQNEIPIYSVETNDKKIALTFDVTFGEDYTNEIIDILHKNDVKATFFLVGQWVDMNPEKVNKIFQNGHEIGNLSNTYSDLTELNSKKIKDQIRLTSEKIKKIIGLDTTLFRAPNGIYNNQIIKVANKAKYSCIQWDVDSMDSKTPGTYFIYNNVIKKADKGSILLFHTNVAQTPLVLDRIIKALKTSGFSFVKTSDLVYKKGFYIDHTGRQRMMK